MMQMFGIGQIKERYCVFIVVILRSGNYQLVFVKFILEYVGYGYDYKVD